MPKVKKEKAPSDYGKQGNVSIYYDIFMFLLFHYTSIISTSVIYLV